MLKVHRWFILLGLVFIVLIGLAPRFLDSGSSKNDFSQWVKQIEILMQEKGYNRSTINLFVNNVKYSSDIAGSKNEYEIYHLDYSNEVLIEAQTVMSTYFDLLKQLEEKYKVPATYVAANIAINKLAPRSNLMNVLATLAYNDKDDLDSIYLRELFSYLLLLQRGYVDVNTEGNIDGNLTILGVSNSFYLNNANVFNKLNTFEVSKELLDVYFSTANFLGWSYNDTWGEEVSIDSKTRLLQGFSNKRSINDWQQLGVYPVVRDGNLSDNKDLQGSLFILRNGNGILVYKNFDILYSFNLNMQKSLLIGKLALDLTSFMQQLEFKNSYVREDISVQEVDPKEPETLPQYEENFEEKLDDMPPAFADVDSYK